MTYVARLLIYFVSCPQVIEITKTTDGAMPSAAAEETRSQGLGGNANSAANTNTSSRQDHTSNSYIAVIKVKSNRIFSNAID